MDIFGNDNLKREDFDAVIKAFYDEAVKVVDTLETPEEKKGFQQACKVFDSVWNSYKKLHD